MPIQRTACLVRHIILLPSPSLFPPFTGPFPPHLLLSTPEPTTLISHSRLWIPSNLSNSSPDIAIILKTEINQINHLINRKVQAEITIIPEEFNIREVTL